MTNKANVQRAESASSAVVAHDSGQQLTPADELTERDVAARAYSYWEARGFLGGSPDEDWYRAVREFEEEQQK